MLTRTSRGLRTARTGYAYQPPACCTYHRRRAACTLYVPASRAVRTAYRGTTGDCYSRDDQPRNASKNQFGEIRVNQGCCCCSFWHSTPAVKSVRSLLQLSNPSAPEPGSTKSIRTISSTLEPGCVRSFPAAWSRPVRAQRAPLRRCDIAVTLSGGLGWRINGLACSLSSLSRHVLQKQPGTCVFVHAGLIRPTTSSLAEAVGLNVTKILDSYASDVLAYELESNDRSTRKAIQNATEHCTRSGGVVGTLFLAIMQRQRHAKFQDKARYSFASMFRHIWLAFRMALEHEMLSGSTLRLIVRARLDHIYSAPLNWPLIERMTAPTPDLPAGRLLIGQPAKHYALASRHGVPHRFRCVMNDQFAVGPPQLVGAYASVFPDYFDFRRVIPMGRNDMVGHTNERILVSHLHYRGAGAAFGSFPLKAHIDFMGCGDSHKFLKRIDPSSRQSVTPPGPSGASLPRDELLRRCKLKSSSRGCARVLGKPPSQPT